MKIQPARSLRGTVTLPGDKSISHRAAMLGGIAGGITRINGFASSQDCQSTLDCMSLLGVSVKKEGDTLLVSRPENGLRKPNEILDVGNSGSTARMLSGILAGQPFTTELTGDDSIRRRPMQRIIDPLTEMGARIESIRGRAPLKISGGNLNPITYRLPVASAQVKSCVLLAGLFVSGETTVIESIPTRNHTELMLQSFGARLSIKSTPGERHITIEGPAELQGQDIFVPGDVSSAAFIVCAALMVPGSEIILKNVGLNPTRTGFIDLLVENGADIQVLDKYNLNSEPAGDLRVRYSRLASRDGRPIQIGGSLVANLIDEIPVLAVLATQSDSGFVIKDAAELRHKESDRIESVTQGLRSMGIDVGEMPDGLIIKGNQKLKGAAVNSHSDHRIAMAFAIAGLAADGQTEIIRAESAAISFPEFFDTLRALTNN